jgi:pimeloyl-ACP methyl ester carboxylesterase
LVIAGRELEIVTIPAQRCDAPTLIFLHEGLGSAGLWRDFPAAVAAGTGCAAVIYSRYGNGFSTPLLEPRMPRYMHDEALVTLPELVSALDLSDVILFGHSDGASIAIMFAAEHPEAVRGVILEAPHLLVEDLSIQSIAAIREEYEHGELRKRMSRYHTDVDRTFYGWNDIWLSPEFRAWNIEEYAARLQAPILAIQGVDDEYGTLAQLDALARLTPGPVDQLRLAHCGHSPHRDRAAFVTDASSAWIERRTSCTQRDMP